MVTSCGRESPFFSFTSADRSAAGARDVARTQVDAGRGEVLDVDVHDVGGQQVHGPVEPALHVEVPAQGGHVAVDDVADLHRDHVVLAHLQVGADVEAKGGEGPLVLAHVPAVDVDVGAGTGGVELQEQRPPRQGAGTTRWRRYQPTPPVVVAQPPSCPSGCSRCAAAPPRSPGAVVERGHLRAHDVHPDEAPRIVEREIFTPRARRRVARRWEIGRTIEGGAVARTIGFGADGRAIAGGAVDHARGGILIGRGRGGLARASAGRPQQEGGGRAQARGLSSHRGSRVLLAQATPAYSPRGRSFFTRASANGRFVAGVDQARGWRARSN
jgi:hypothetical protein